MQFKKFLCIILCGNVFASMLSFGAINKTISLDFHEVRLKEALHILANFIDLNIILSPQIEGQVTVHLHSAKALNVLDEILAAHHLVKWQEGDVWLVGTNQDFIRHKQEEMSVRNIENETDKLVTRVWQIHYSRAEDLAQILQDKNRSLISARGQVHVDVRTNIIFVHDFEKNMLEMNRLIKRLDVPVRQILIEARLASIDHDYEDELGIRFSVQKSGSNEYPSSQNIPIVKLLNNSFLDLQLSALEKKGCADIISRPSLFTANLQTAAIEAGEEIPYQEVSLSGGTTVAFKKAVLSLKVTPQILPNNNIHLQLQINQDKPSKRMILGVPAITTRQLMTQVLVKNGQTIVLGGIYETDNEAGKERVPFLSKIPLVGLLFQQQNSSHTKRELLIFVTPRIIG